MIIQLQLISELVGKDAVDKSPGLWSKCQPNSTTAPVTVKHYVTSSRMYVTRIRMYVTKARMYMDVHGRCKQEGNLAWYPNLRIYKLYVIICYFIHDYSDTAVVQYFFNFVTTEPGYGWSLPLSQMAHCKPHHTMPFSYGPTQYDYHVNNNN